MIIKDEEFLELNKNLDKELKSSSTMNSKYQRPIIKSPNLNSKKSFKSNKQNSYNNSKNKQNTIKFNEKSFDSTFTSQNTSLINKSFHNNNNNVQSFYEHDISEVSHIKNQFLESNTIQKLCKCFNIFKIIKISY
jgi:hypothetical protein